MQTICGAKTRSGEPCKGKPMLNGRCRMHGGSTPSGIALPQTKTGRYSKYLPDNIRDRYHQALGDNELISLRDEIALVEVQIVATLEAQTKPDAPPEDIIGARARLYDLIEQRRRLVETERKRLVDMQQMITSEQAMLLVGALVGIIRARVNDPSTLAAIQSDINGLLAQRDRGAVNAA